MDTQHRPDRFAHLLRRGRREAGLTQEALAERAGLAWRTISDLERAVKLPRRDTLDLLTVALGLAGERRTAFEAAARRQPTATAQPSNLPIGLTSFVGRGWERRAVGEALARARLVTLTGAGGCGKTRLALAVAGDLLGRYEDGAWLVELAAVADPGLVISVAAQALGVVEQSGQPLLTTLGDFLQPRRLLLVLDNCEHLVGACAGLIDALLRRCPTLWVLATSREALGVPGENSYRVPSLSVPDPAKPSSAEGLLAYEAVQLFVERAQARRPAFQLTSQNAGAVGEVCARLDGLPLAIELAAARVSVLAVEAIAARLDDQFRLLTGGPRTALPRQQTLRATLDWSYDLLTAGEQLLLIRLAVFAGGWTLAGAEAVGAGPGVEAWAVLDLLGGLVAKSLVQAEAVGEGMRYGLLETVRQYGRERLLAAGEIGPAQHRHAAYHLALVECCEREVGGPDQLRGLGRLERELDNLRAALAWCLDGSKHGEPDEVASAVETGLRLAGSLHAFWRDRDHHREGLAWLDQLLAHGAAAPAAVRAQALNSAGILAGSANDLTRAQALLTQSIVLGREAGDRRQLSRALGGLGWAMAANGQDVQAAAAVEESLTLARAVGQPRLIAHALFHDLLRIVYGTAIECAEERARAWAAGAECLEFSRAAGDTVGVAKVRLHMGQIALYEGDHARARAEFVASLPAIRALGWRSTVAEGLVGLADVARKQASYAEAAALYTEALTLFRQLGDQRQPAFAAVLSRLADVALESGDWTAAQTHAAESLAIAQDMGLDGASQLAGALEVQAALAAVQGTPARSVRLAGAAAALRTYNHQSLSAPEQATDNELVHLSLTQHRLNRSLAASDQDTLERRLAPALQALSADEQTTAWAEGQAMTPEQAIAYALDGLAQAQS